MYCCKTKEGTLQRVFAVHFDEVCRFERASLQLLPLLLVVLESKHACANVPPIRVKQQAFVQTKGFGLHQFGQT